MAPARISPPSTPIKEVKSNDLQHGSPTSLLAMPAMRRNPSYTISSKKPTDVAADSSSMYFIRNTVQSLEKKGAADLGYGVFESVSNTTYINLVEYIANERLSSLPHRGSTWDTVLIRALYFAERHHGFEKIMKGFGSEDSAANLAYGYSKLLLELGHENADALDKAFAVLYKHALDVAALLWRMEVVVETTPKIREHLSLMYGDLLTLTSVVAHRYYKVTQGITSATLSLDIYDVCSDVIESFRDRQETVTDLIWQHQARVEGIDLNKDLSAKTLRRWLVPMDPVQTTLTQDHTIQLAGQAEYTCLWFSKQLSSFVQGESKVMAVTGHSGCGKSVLAASVVERLQRALGRKTWSTLYYSIHANMPAATTPISILKSLLGQIFNLRIGDMKTYHAVARAFNKCYTCGDVKGYEEHLWEALDDALKTTLDKARDLVIVVDGLDEIHGGKHVSQAFFERLSELVCDGKKVKLIGLAEHLSMPSGINSTHVTVTRENVQEDIRAVILRTMARSDHFHHRSSEQEQILDRIAKTANGSFVWALLVSEILVYAKSCDEIIKHLDEYEKSKPSVPDLVSKILSRNELSATTRIVVGWIVDAERPLTVFDMDKLFAHGHTHDHHTNVSHALEVLSPILAKGDYIKQFKHRSIFNSVKTLVHSGKIVIPHDLKQADILLRGLSYAKTVFKDDPDPELDDHGFEITDRVFREHPLLAYVVRYWTAHLEDLGTKHPKELATVLPNVTIMPMIEKVVWEHEVPLIQAVGMHKKASDIRHQYLKDPSPASLQSAINAAVIYDILERHADARPLYYWSAKMAHRLHLDILAMELGHRYLHVSESCVEKRRTEIMTQREAIYIILITLLIKEYGSSSYEVIQMRTYLAKMYEDIHEKTHAAEIWELIHEATVHLHGHDSTEARGISDHLRVHLGRTKSQDKIQIRKDTIFDEDKDVIDNDSLDLVTIGERLRGAKTEWEFIELWQRVSTISRSTMLVEWHEMNISVAMAYSKFLVSHKRTSEASSVMTSVTREYESHQVSFSETIVSRLTESATFLTEIGSFAAALSILKSTSYFHHSSTTTESHRSVEIQRQISIVESKLIETCSSETHVDIMERVFRSAILDKTKTVDLKLVTITKTLVVQHMEQLEYRNSVEIIKLLLSRVWSSFLSGSYKEVEMITTFHTEVIAVIVDYMVPCYTYLREPMNAEWALSTLFGAALMAKTVDFTLVKRVQTLLLEHYDSHHFPEKSISVLQRALIVRRSHLGKTHKETIETLYELARRSHQHPRIYPGWIDYYQQIVTYLNSGRETCAALAMEALVIVATTYWEDGRYDDAIFYHHLLWTTFIREPKQHLRFGQAEFVQRLYEHYYMCLERTSARFETLYQITKQYHSTCVTVFGASAELTVRATLSLARVLYSSEEHTSEALSLYEHVSKHSSSTFVHKSEIQTALTTLYTREISSTTTKTSTETIESAQTRSYSRFESAVSKYGYSSSSTLSYLHEVAMLYHKQSKTESITKELTTATTEIISKETSSRTLIESAESLVTTFQATSTMVYLERMITELHRQIICKDTTNSRSIGFDVSKHGRSVLPFLAAMIFKSSKDKLISFSHLMADLLTEMLYFEDYRSLVKSNGSLQDILLSASALRAFLVKIKRVDAVASLDKDVASIFLSRDGGKMKLLKKSSAQIFMVSIMEYLGAHRHSSFIKAVVLASNERVERLMAKEQYAEAYDIANCAFEFALENEGYNGPKGISHGFNLASNLAGIGYSKKCTDADLRKQMLHLSNNIAKKILEVCKQQDIKFTEIQLRELNRLVVLLGVQEDYETLEWLLTSLWNTREAHRDWSATTLHNLGKDLICARYLAGNPIKALRLCEDVAYNLRRTNGMTDPVTREMNVLLAELYSSTGLYYLQQGKSATNTELANQYFAKALAIHEETLRGVVNDPSYVDEDDDEWDTTGEILREHGISLKLQGDGHANGSMSEVAVAKTHLRLLKLTIQRLGSWPGSYAAHEKLVGQVQGAFPDTKDIQTPDKWQIKGYGHGKAESNEGTFTKVDNWQLMDV